ncbi:MAG: hypothetical protein CVU77_06080 [Elusimicrobia bacterium HGW-Elusimicrobia-1]|jgi:predicted GIY-YIG superfamily endonuclease|nr:MAG: hypothetical protein CVU79_08325 [Elusimicrobia bacterium HGW-Elusimicrobia-3]PKN01272.1 MAG: hypothetical protein CVU77_06080 [Elusimicrobia bacterium HGW-Elusimicrobia-1]
MKEKSEDKHISSVSEPWQVYIVRCNNSSLYTGITKNLSKRIEKHNSGKGAAYTRIHRPVKLVYTETLKNRSEALIREMQIKSLSRPKKESLLSLCKE